MTQFMPLEAFWEEEKGVCLLVGETSFLGWCYQGTLVSEPFLGQALQTSKHRWQLGPFFSISQGLPAVPRLLPAPASCQCPRA